ncbi:unnamed protein product [Darwinula stevensoni]|uniref:Apple domain-containing protein n=1 Tax=Darwinula stevensoni TaxID=69355 RepID=A0A7R9FRQ4_9CRUS|nr:unnamed protein product [Darwinula stevensoni]CAG0902183.1 unnamed protein product [Darwinula stevensoni]
MMPQRDAQSGIMNEKRGIFMLVLLSVSIERGESVAQQKFMKVNRGGRVFLTPNLVQTKAGSSTECAFQCIGNSNCVAFHWLPSGGTCQLVPGDGTVMDVRDGGGLELYQPEAMAKGETREHTFCPLTL